MSTNFFYLRLILGFVGIIILAAGSVFLAHALYQNRYFDIDIVTLVLFLGNTAILCIIILKVFKSIIRNHA